MWMLTGGVEGHEKGKRFWQSMMGYRAHREVQQARAIDETRWMQERVRDVVAANEVYNYLNEKIAGVIEDRITFAELLPELNDARRFTDGMPSTRVAITVKTHYHRNGRHRWRDNDMYDVDMISVAVPYCDAVYTDKAVRNALVSNDDVEILFGTFMPRRPEQLTDWLRSRPASH